MSNLKNGMLFKQPIQKQADNRLERGAGKWENFLNFGQKVDLFKTTEDVAAAAFSPINQQLSVPKPGREMIQFGPKSLLKRWSSINPLSHDWVKDSLKCLLMRCCQGE